MIKFFSIRSLLFKDMQRAKLKRKGATDILNQHSQLKITKYLNIPSSTPVNRKIQINPTTASKETIRSQLIRCNLDQIISNDKQKAANNQNISKPDLNTESCRSSDEHISRNNVEEELLIDDESSHTTKYCREKAKYWEKLVKKYKEQFDFTNK